MQEIKCNFGKLIFSKKIEDQYFWSSQINSQIWGTVPICIFTKNDILNQSFIEFVENIVKDIDLFIEKSVIYLQKELKEKSNKYKISVDIINTGTERVPVDFPEIIFYDKNEFMIRFNQGEFEICEPYGIGIFFEQSKPTRIENLSDSEEIE